MQETPLPIFIGYSVNYFDDSDLISWAVEYIQISEHFEDNTYLMEIAWLNTKQQREVEKAGGFLKEFVEQQWSSFRLSSPKSELHANRYFRKRLEQYLHDACSPWAVCRMVSPIEQFFDNPDWLGDMYNACDWITPNYEPVHCRHLEDDVRDTLALDPVTIPAS